MDIFKNLTRIIKFLIRVQNYKTPSHIFQCFRILATAREEASSVRGITMPTRALKILHNLLSELTVPGTTANYLGCPEAKRFKESRGGGLS